MRCSQCGEEYIEGAVFCRHCGASTAPAVTEEHSERPDPTSVQAEAETAQTPGQAHRPQAPEHAQTAEHAPPPQTAQQPQASGNRLYPEYQNYTYPNQTQAAHTPESPHAYPPPPSSRTASYGIVRDEEPPRYQPYPNPAPVTYDGSARAAMHMQDAPRPLSIKQLFGIELLSLIPVINLVFLCIWALSNHGNPNRARLAQAKLAAFMLVTAVVLIAAAVLMLLIAADVIDGVYLGRWTF